MADGEIILYTTPDGIAEVQLRSLDGTVWLSQAEMADLFKATKQNISHHIGNILEEGELQEEATVKSYLTVRQEGNREVSRSIKLFNLDMILAIGYRVRSTRGTQFRQWATTHLREYLVKGFVMDDERLKEPGGWDYFDELLERIRDIRASEKRFYQKVKDLFTETSMDYDKRDETARTFFKTIQNKMLFSVTGQTAAELVVSRLNADKPNMGLTSWKGGRVRKGDVTTAKNYLTSDEITQLNLIVTMFLDFAELRASRKEKVYMADWIVQADRFIEFNERPVLNHKGKISHDRMEKIAHQTYGQFDDQRRGSERQIAEMEAIEDLRRIEVDVQKRVKKKSK